MKRCICCSAEFEPLPNSHKRKYCYGCKPVRKTEPNAFRICATCGVGFHQTHGGPPRRECYGCNPPRLRQPRRGLGRDREGEQARQMERLDRQFQTIDAAAPKPQLVEVVACVWCHQPTDGVPFCSEQHRAAFAHRVAAARLAAKVRARGPVGLYSTRQYQGEI